MIWILAAVLLVLYVLSALAIAFIAESLGFHASELRSRWLRVSLFSWCVGALFILLLVAAVIDAVSDVSKEVRDFARMVADDWRGVWKGPQS